MNKRRITAFDDRGREVATYPSVSAAARDRGARPQNILQAVALGTRCAGLRWAYVSDAAEQAQPPAPVQIRPHAQVGAYVTYDAAGLPVGRYATQLEVARALDVSKGAVSQALRSGGRTGAGEFRVRRAGQAAPEPLVSLRVVTYDDAGQPVATYQTQADAARALGEELTTLGQALHGGHRLRQGLRVQLEGHEAPGPWRNTSLRGTRAYNDAGELVGEYASRFEAATAHGLLITA